MEPELDLKTKDLPDILYHYTSQEGLLGIIGNEHIWATDILYLNDATEYTYTHKMIIDVLNNRLKSISTCTDDILKDSKELDAKTISALVPRSGLEGEFQFIQYIDILMRALNNIKAKNYVCSLSEMGDQLSQWRGYCQGGYGYSIGFDPKIMLEQFSKNKHSLLIKCIYEEARQRQIIENILPPYLDKALTSPPIGGNVPEGDIPISLDLMQCVFSLFSLVPQFKHKKFEEETEWRFVYKEAFPTINLRPGKSMLLPYVALPLTGGYKDGRRLQLTVVKEIIVGPTPHPELSMNSVETLLKQNNIGNCNIRQSEVPYRSW